MSAVIAQTIDGLLLLIRAFVVFVMVLALALLNERRLDRRASSGRPRYLQDERRDDL